MDIKIHISYILGNRQMISSSAEYSLRAVVCLAMSAGKPMTTHRMARLTQVPVGYLAKVLHALGRAGIVSSQRGAGGGHVLGPKPENLTLLEIIRVADASNRIPVCPLGIAAHGVNLCALHRKLDQAVELAEQVLTRTTVADVLADSTRQPLCEARTVGLEVSRAGNDRNRD